MGPAFLRAMPHWLMVPLTKHMIAREDRNARAGDVTMRMLAPTLHYDLQLISESEGPLERFKDIRADLLLLGGRKSPAYLQTSVETLSNVFPRARRVTFTGLGHEASGNANQWGKPEQVARENNPGRSTPGGPRSDDSADSCDNGAMRSESCGTSSNSLNVPFFWRDFLR